MRITNSQEVAAYLWIGCAILSFPSSLVTLSIAGAVQSVLFGLGFNNQNAYFINTIIWTFVVSIGYIQWFMITPYVIRFFRKKIGTTKPARTPTTR